MLSGNKGRLDKMFIKIYMTSSVIDHNELILTLQVLMIIFCSLIVIFLATTVYNPVIPLKVAGSFNQIYMFYGLYK